MRTCDDIEMDLSAYHDGELTPPERANVEAHLAACPSCQTALAAIKTSHAVLAALPKLKSPAGLFAKVSAQIGTPEMAQVARNVVAPRRKRAFWLPWASGIAATLLFGVLAYTYFVKPVDGRTETGELAKASTPPAEAKEKEIQEELAKDNTNRSLEARKAGDEYKNEEAPNRRRLNMNDAVKLRPSDPQQLDSEGAAAKAFKKSENSPGNAPQKPGEMQTELRVSKGEAANREAPPMAKAPAEPNKTAPAPRPAPPKAEAPQPATAAKPNEATTAASVSAVPLDGDASKSKADSSLDPSAARAPRETDGVRARLAPTTAPADPPKPFGDAKRKTGETPEQQGAAQFNKDFAASEKKDAPASPPAPAAPNINGVADRAAELKQEAAKDAPRMRRETEDKTDPDSRFQFRGGGGGGGGRGGTKPSNSGKDGNTQVVLLRAPDVSVALQKVREVAAAHQATLVPFQLPAVVEQSRENEFADKPVSPVKTPPGKTEYLLTVGAGEAALLLAELNALQNTKAFTQLNENAAPAAATAGPAKDPKAAKPNLSAPPAESAPRRAEAQVTIHVTIETLR